MNLRKSACIVKALAKSLTHKVQILDSKSIEKELVDSAIMANTKALADIITEQVLANIAV